MVGYHKRSDPATMYSQGGDRPPESTGRAWQAALVRILMPAGDWVASGFIDLDPGRGHAGGSSGIRGPHHMDKDTYDQYISFVNYYIHQVKPDAHLWLWNRIRPTYAEVHTGVCCLARRARRRACVIEDVPPRPRSSWAGVGGLVASSTAT